MKDLYAKDIQIHIVRMEEQATLSENFTESDFYFWTAAKYWTKIMIADMAWNVDFHRNI